MSLFFVNSQQDNDLDGETASAPATSAAAVSQNVSEAHQALLSFWPRVTEEIKKISQVRLDVKTQALPLARIKKIMKLDEDVKMISAEAPMLFSKAAELFIHELTLRAWIHTEDNKRRTLQRNDIAMAITKYDQFDFLIDIVPRDEIKTSSSRSTNETRTPINPDQVHYYFQLAQQHQAALQQSSTTPAATPASTAPAPAPTIQVVQPSSGLHTITVTAPNDQQNGVTNTSNSASQPQMVQLQTSQGQTGIQLVQQMVTANGEIQNVPFSPVHFLLPKPLSPLLRPAIFIIITDKLNPKIPIPALSRRPDSAVSQSATDDQNANKRRNVTTHHPTNSSSDHSGQSTELGINTSVFVSDYNIKQQPIRD